MRNTWIEQKKHQTSQFCLRRILQLLLQGSTSLMKNFIVTAANSRTARYERGTTFV